MCWFQFAALHWEEYTNWLNFSFGVRADDKHRAAQIIVYLVAVLHLHVMKTCESSVFECNAMVYTIYYMMLLYLPEMQFPLLVLCEFDGIKSYHSLRLQISNYCGWLRWRDSCDMWNVAIRKLKSKFHNLNIIAISVGRQRMRITFTVHASHSKRHLCRSIVFDYVGKYNVHIIHITMWNPYAYGSGAFYPV